MRSVENDVDWVDHSDPQRMAAYNISSPSARVQGARRRYMFPLAFFHGPQTENIFQGVISQHLDSRSTLSYAPLSRPSLSAALYVTKWHHAVRRPRG